jgi:hypothetical protein
LIGLESFFISDNLLKLTQAQPFNFHKQSIDLKRTQAIAFTFANKFFGNYTVKVNGKNPPLNLTSGEWHTAFIQLANASTAIEPLNISLVPSTNPYLASVGLASKGSTVNLKNILNAKNRITKVTKRSSLTEI